MFFEVVVCSVVKQISTEESFSQCCPFPAFHVTTFHNVATYGSLIQAEATLKLRDTRCWAERDD